MKRLLKKIRGLLDGARKRDAHEDGAAGRVYERAVVGAVAGFLNLKCGGLGAAALIG